MAIRRACVRDLCIALFVGAWMVLAAGCGRKEGIATEKKGPSGETPLIVYTTFYPTKYFVERIAGDRVKAICPVPAGQDPPFWMPDSSTISNYQAADLILINGATYEKWVDKVSLPVSKLVDTTKPLEAELLKIPGAIVHTHGPGGAHTHEGLNPHTWLDPLNAVRQADEVRKALLRALPADAKRIDAGYAALVADLKGLDADLRALGEPPPMLCSHPTYDYLARHYGWKIRTVALDPEAVPDETQWGQIREALKDFPARLVVWEEPPAAAVSAWMTKEFGLESVVFSPCELPSEREIRAGSDYIEVMKQNVANLRKTLQKP